MVAARLYEDRELVRILGMRRTMFVVPLDLAPIVQAACTRAIARVELVRRWLTAFGPGTPADVKWWTGWTAGEAKRAVEKLGAVEVELDGATGLPAAGGRRRRRRPGYRHRRRAPSRLDRRRPRHPPLPNTPGTPAQRLRSVVGQASAVRAQWL